MNSMRSGLIAFKGFILLVLCGCILFFAAGEGGQVKKEPLVGSLAFPRAVGMDSLESIPLYFTPNRGQVRENALFYAKTPQYTLWIAGDEMVFDSLRSRAGAIPAMMEKGEELSPERMVVRVKFEGADPECKAVPLGKTAHRVSCYFGADPKRWAPNVPTFETVQLKDVYPGIDLHIYGRDREVEYDWIVRPGGRVSDIRISIIGAEGTGIDETGNLIAHTRFGDIRHKKPRSRQEPGGKPVAVESRFVGLGENCYGFDVGKYDPHSDLIIDPLVNLQSTYLGGSSNDYGSAVAVGPDGRVFLAGYTYSTDFPLQETLHSDKAGYDMFLTKFSPSGGSLEFSTYIGGSGHERCYDLAVDDAGNIYLAGYTKSQDFPAPSAVQTGFEGQTTMDTVLGADCAVVNISKENLLKWAKTRGGSGDDHGICITMLPGKTPMASPDLIIGGSTSSSDFPTSPDAYQLNNAGGTDGLIWTLDGLNGNTQNATYFGGPGTDCIEEIHVQSSGEAPGGAVLNIVTGRTNSTDFPTSADALQKNNAGGDDAFLALFPSDWDTLIYSSYHGGSANDVAKSICVDSLGNIYVTGTTGSTDFPTKDPYQANKAGFDDMFFSKFTPDGTDLLFSSYLGGMDYDTACRIRVDKFGKIYLAGDTHSVDFPTKNPLYTDTDGELEDSILTVFRKDLSLYYSTYAGGTEDDRCGDLFVDPGGKFALLGGTTLSTDFPLKNSYQGHQGSWDAFYMKITDTIIESIAVCGDTGVFQKYDQSSPWKKIASAASAGGSGDFDGDGQGDLIGNWLGQGGVWMQDSATELWSFLASPTDKITAGDMNGDGLDDLVGSWPGQGVYYRCSFSGDWYRMASTADDVAVGDLDGDGRDDLIGIWPGQGGVWAKFSRYPTWQRLASSAESLWAGDMNGDGRDDLVGSWAGQGVYYRCSGAQDWHRMATAADDVAAGDVDGDGRDDLIGKWPGEDRLWQKRSTTGDWVFWDIPEGEKLYSCFPISPGVPFAEGPPMTRRVTAAEGRDLSSLFYRGSTPENARRGGTFLDLSHLGPGGAHFVFSEEINAGPPRFVMINQRIPGPGDPGFRCREEANLVPGKRKK